MGNLNSTWTDEALLELFTSGMTHDEVTGRTGMDDREVRAAFERLFSADEVRPAHSRKSSLSRAPRANPDRSER